MGLDTRSVCIRRSKAGQRQVLAPHKRVKGFGPLGIGVAKRSEKKKEKGCLFGRPKCNKTLHSNVHKCEALDTK